MDVASMQRDVVARARRELARRGLEVHRTVGVRRTLPAVLERFVSLGLSPATVIDVGVGLGTAELYDAFPHAQLVLVEPLPEAGPMKRLKAQRGAELIAAAAGAQAGEVQIAVHRVPHLSTVLGARQDGVTPEIRTVEMVRLDDAVTQPGPYVLKVDVEGAELGVLAGAERLLTQCELVLLEVSFFALVEGQPQFHDVVAWMHEHGFVVAELYNGHNRPLDGALAMMDAAFVAEHGRFRQEHRYATPAQADALYRQWHR